MNRTYAILIAASAFSFLGCSSKSELPKPTGNKVALNKAGIPVELAIQLARSNTPKPTPTPNVSAKINQPAKLGASDTSNSFSHAKNSENGKANISHAKDKTAKDSNVNGIVSPAMALNIKPTIADSVAANPAFKVKVESIKPNQVKSSNIANTTKVINPIIPAKAWDAKVGETLRGVLERWSSGETCKANERWTVINWPDGVDYSIDSALRFNGTYYDAVSQLFDLYKSADVPLYVDLYNPKNSPCVVYVSDTPNTRKK